MPIQCTYCDQGEVVETELYDHSKVFVCQECESLWPTMDVSVAPLDSLNKYAEGKGLKVINFPKRNDS